jgi:hypothetical protein
MTSSERTNRLDHATELIAEIDGELELRQNPQNVLEHMRKGAITDLRAELEKLSRILATPQHKLVFIGQVGVGKTTAICHLAGLTAEREKKKKVSKSGPEKAIRVTEDLMATGSGFTTLCEVVVKPAHGSGNRFEVEPSDRDEVERTISEFCQALWRKVYPDTDDLGQKTGEQLNFPVELVRAVRNMVKLPEGDKQDDDSAMRLAREFATDAFEQFRGAVVTRANLEKRTQTEFICSPGELDPRAWIKKTFDDLNLARVDTVSIPRRITLHVDSALLSPHVDRVASLVDTKGVDASQFNRADLDLYIREDDSAICILAERFDTAPTNLIPVLQRHIVREAPLTSSKFIIMVIPRGSDPEKVVGGQGPLGDRDAGIDLRRNHIEDTLSSYGIPRLGERLCFFDPLRHFDFVGNDYRRKADAELDEIEAERNDVWVTISHAISMREDQVWDRVPQIRESLKKIRDGKGLDPGEEELVLQAKQRIQQYRHITVANADRFVELFRNLWAGPGARHHMSLRATNNRFGIYPYRNIDIYYDAIPISEQLVRTAAARPKEAVLDIVRHVLSSSPKESDLRELFAVLETRIEASFEDLIRAVGARMHDYLRDTAFYPRDQSNQFWIDVQARYGTGPGFRDDVLSMYADQMDGHEEILVNAADDCWQSIVIDPILQYLG